MLFYFGCRTAGYDLLFQTPLIFVLTVPLQAPLEGDLLQWQFEGLWFALVYGVLELRGLYSCYYPLAMATCYRMLSRC